MREQYKLTYEDNYSNRRYLIKLIFDSQKYSLYEELKKLSPLKLKNVRVYDSNNKFVVKLNKI